MDLSRIEVYWNDFFSWIEQHQIFGVSLDVGLHLVVGMLLGLIWLGWRKWSPTRAMRWVLGMACLKELIDAKALLHHQSFQEPFFDIFWTWVGFGLAWGILGFLNREKAA